MKKDTASVIHQILENISHLLLIEKPTERERTKISYIGRIPNMIKSEQTNINGYGNTGANLSNISLSSGGMAAMNNGAGDDNVNIGLGMAHDNWTSHDQQCCLVEAGRRCSRVAGNASYSKRIQKTVAQRKLKLHMDNSARHIYICDHHKELIQSLRTKRKRKDSEDDSGETDSEHPEVDLYQLQVNTLRRYKKHYKVPVRQGLNKAQLADCMMRHFKTIPVVEKEALTFFIYMVKTNKSKLDNRHGIEPNHRSMDSMDRD